MASASSDLCERIRQHCQQRRWYGSDLEHDYLVTYGLWVPYRRAGSPGPQLDMDEQDPEPPVERFARAPATAAHIAQAEQALGRELPAALKAISLSLANGAFGPGMGLEDVGGLIHIPGPHGGWQLSERAAHYLEVYPRRYLECDHLPEGLVHLCTRDWEFGPESVLDLNSGRVYGTNNASFYSDLVGFFWIVFEATSLEVWFEQWLSGTLDCPFSHLERLEEPSEPDDMP